MRKLILACIILICIGNNVFADGKGSGSTGSTCIESHCMNDRIDELIKVNTELQKENKDLQIKMTKFDSGLENYVKILAESKEQSKWKSEAYDIALNQIKYWAWGVGFILSTVGIVFGIWRGKQLETARETFESEIKDYREYITKIDDTIIKSSVINIFHEQKDKINSEIFTYIETTFRDKLNGEISFNVKQEVLDTFKDEFKMNKKILIDDIIIEIENNKKHDGDRYDELDAFEGISL